MTRINPVRFIKDGAKGSYYEAKTSCGSLKIIICDDDDYPVRLTAQTVGGGCEANLEGLQRLVSLLLEINARVECIIEQLDKPICPQCKTKLVRGEKDIALSCPKAIAQCLKKHMENENGKG